MTISTAFRRLGRRVERSKALYRLNHQGNRITQRIAQSIRASLNLSVTDDERSAIDRIEHLRSEMYSSTTRITRRDYGAGDHDSKRTKEQMLAGVEVVDTLGHLSQALSKPPSWCNFLFRLLRTTGSERCIEMGTAVGVSGAYQATALQLNGHGRLVTLEGAQAIAEIARSNFQRLGLDSVEIVVGRFDETLPKVLTETQPVDYVFIDGHHDERATVAYFEQILPFLADSALLVFDDITWSDGMARAWKTIAGDRRVGVAVDLGPVGLCVVDKSISWRNYVSVTLH
jgi:predicted O-methyltransferase YrrM